MPTKHTQERERGKDNMTCVSGFRVYQKMVDSLCTVRHPICTRNDLRVAFCFTDDVLEAAAAVVAVEVDVTVCARTAIVVVAASVKLHVRVVVVAHHAASQRFTVIQTKKERERVCV